MENLRKGREWQCQGVWAVAQGWGRAGEVSTAHSMKGLAQLRALRAIDEGEEEGILCASRAYASLS